MNNNIYKPSFIQPLSHEQYDAEHVFLNYSGAMEGRVTEWENVRKALGT